MSNTSFGLEVEDWSLIVLRTGNTYCSAETGFLFPAPTGTYDVQFTVRTDRHYIFSGFESTEILTFQGERITARTPAANDPTYALFVRDVLRRFRAGEPPLDGTTLTAALRFGIRVAQRPAVQTVWLVQ